MTSLPHGLIGLAISLAVSSALMFLLPLVLRHRKRPMATPFIDERDSIANFKRIHKP